MRVLGVATAAVALLAFAFPGVASAFPTSASELGSLPGLRAISDIPSTAARKSARRPGHAKRRTLQVDDDRRQCPNAPHQTINAAVAAASPGDRVLVCPGSYNEHVTVAKPRLHLQALSGRAARAYRADCFDPAPSDPNRDAILEGLSPAFVLLGFDLQADDIEVEGFVFEEHFNAAVFTRETASGHFVHDNLFQDYFASGMNFNNGGAKRAVVRKNCFRITSDRGVGNAMRADQGLRNALIDRNRFFQSGQSGMALAPLEDIEDLTISHNLGVRELTLLFIARSVGTRVIGNDALDSDPGPFLAGVFWFGEHNRDTLIARNRVRRGPTGFRFDHSLGVRPNVNLRVLHNDIAEMSGSGMLAPTEEDPPDPGLVDSLFFANSSVSNAQDGIRFEAGGATGNLVIRNHLRRNGEHDCHDDTVGAGTAGTANTWRDNDALTENRPGLCPPRDDRGAG